MGESMPEVLKPQIINGLRNYAGYLGFRLWGEEFAALANAHQFFNWRPGL